MKKKWWFVGIFCVALFFALAVPTTVIADDWDHATKLTFTEPVEVPGLALPAGTYWFLLADSDSDRNIVQIWNADRTQLITTILAIPDYRLQPTGKQSLISLRGHPINRKQFIPGFTPAPIMAKSLYTRKREPHSLRSKRANQFCQCLTSDRKLRHRSNSFP